MFYLTDNSLKKGGKFYLAWMADSWPSRFAKVNIRQLMSTDIVFVCDQLNEVISRESQSPMKHFSLRLSSQLLHGTVRVYERKATLFLNELCMFNVKITRQINERNERIKKTVKRTPAVIEAEITAESVPADLTREEERLFANLLQYNVAQHDAISLREDVIPTIVEPCYDGFGEENPEETIEMFLQSEAMRREDGTIANLTGQLNESALERSQNVTRDAGLSRSGMELEASVREEKRTGLEKQDENLLLVPESNIYAKQLKKAIDIIVSSTPINDAEPDEVVPTQAHKNDLVVELAPPPAKHPRVKRRFIFDMKTKLDSEYMMRRQNPNVALRCKTSQQDVVTKMNKPAQLFTRPTMLNDNNPIFGKMYMGLFSTSISSLPLKRIHDGFHRFSEERQPDNTANLSAARAAITETPKQSTKETKSKRSKEKLPSIIEEVEGPVQQASQPLHLLAEAIGPEQPMNLNTAEQAVVDLTLNEEEPLYAGRRTRSRSSRSLSQVFQQVEVVAQIHAPMHTEEQPVIRYDGTRISIPHVTNALEELGLASSNRRTSKETYASDSDTAGGSIDRTLVDLGDESFTSLQLNRRSAWGPEAVMLKIISLVRSGHQTITVNLLLESGSPSQSKRITAAIIFNSLLRLHSASMVKLLKCENSNQLKNIILGDRFKPNI